MKRLNLFALSIALLTSFIGITNTQAQVTGMPAGYSTSGPLVSTSEAPIWYNLMSSNQDVARANRYLTFNGTALKTEQFNTGIGESAQNDKYLWRLEQGAVGGAGYVVFINKTSGKKLFIAANATTNSLVSVADEGIEWKMAATTSLAGVTGTLPGQYYFNFQGGTDNRYLNATDGVSFAFDVMTFNTNGSVAKSSGWFFYPITATKTVTFAQPVNGSVAVTATNGTATPSSVANGGNVLLGTVTTISLTPDAACAIESLKVNDVDVTSTIVDNKYLFPLNADATVVATFKIITNIQASKTEEFKVFIHSNELVLSAIKGLNKVEIFNMQGVKVLSATSNLSNMNINSLLPGSYIVKATSQTKVYTQKMVK